MPMKSLFDKYINSIKDVDTIHYTGSVTAIKGSLIESKGPQCVFGEDERNKSRGCLHTMPCKEEDEVNRSTFGGTPKYE